MKTGRHSATRREQLQQPYPGQAAEGHFEAACPVRTPRIGIGLLPGIPLRQEFPNVAFFVGEKPGLGQSNQVLMAAQLPCDLVIADLGKIKKVDLEPWDERRAQTVCCVKMPIDFCAVIEVAVSQ